MGTPLRDRQVEDSLQAIKAKKKHKSCRVKDKAIMRLIEQYDSGALSRLQYADALLKTLPTSANISD